MIHCSPALVLHGPIELPNEVPFERTNDLKLELAMMLPVRSHTNHTALLPFVLPKWYKPEIQLKPRLIEFEFDPATDPTVQLVPTFDLHQCPT